MKKIARWLLLLAILISANLGLADLVLAADTNMVANPSLLNMDSSTGKPASWLTNMWGTNTAVFAVVAGRTDAKAARVTVTNWKDGDAKWYPELIPLASGQKYYFSSYYKSTASSELVAMFYDKNGQQSFLWLTTPAKKSNWTKTGVYFTTPNDVVLGTILHVATSNGFLTVDDYSLKPASSLLYTDNVPNNSLEQVSDSGVAPLGWSNNKWGTNTANFTYQNSGHSGTRSVKTTITAYTSGDAKWYPESIKVASNTTYRFSDYYQSDIESRVVLEIRKTNGGLVYQALKNAPASLVWQKYSDVFTTPNDVASLTVFHLISAVGYLVVDDYSLAVYTPTGFARPLVSLTFDDGWEENYDSVLPILVQYGFRSTQYFATTFIEAQPTEQFKIAAIADAGHEIGSHSISHPDLTTLGDAELENQLSASKIFLEKFAGIGKVRAFATPYGSYNTRVSSAIMRYFESNRNTDAGFNTKDGMIVDNIRVQNMLSTTTLPEFNSWLEMAQKDKSWLVLVYHRITNNPGSYDTYKADFAAQISALASSGITVKTISDAIAELKPQI
jgi:peptidoglycan/xylan/chitin deacetylase (PgdA/CDA1 family)